MLSVQKVKLLPPPIVRISLRPKQLKRESVLT